MIYILLPSFNEEKGLQELLPRLIQLTQNKGAFKVVVVDDGSKDRTSSVARSFQGKMDLHLITFPKNQGVGEVFRQGFQYVCEDSKNPQEDICIALDADNTQDPENIFPMIERIRQGDDIVIASRFEGEGHMVGCPFLRYLYSLGVSILLRTLTGMPRVKDFSIFYRAYRVSILQEGFRVYEERLIAGKGFAVIAGLLLKLANLTSRISEIPFILRYDLKTGASGNKILRTINGYLDLIGEYITSNRYRRWMKTKRV